MRTIICAVANCGKTRLVTGRGRTKYCEEHAPEMDRVRRQKYRQEHLEEALSYRQEHWEEVREYNRKYRQEHREELRERDRTYRQKHQKENRERCKKYGQRHREELRKYDQALQRRFSRMKRYAKKRGLEFSIIFEEWQALVAQPCHYCGDNLPLTGGGTDRIDSSLGYVPSNCAPCCTVCNIAKHTMTYAEFRAWVYRVSHSTWYKGKKAQRKARKRLLKDHKIRVPI
jgi:hypothetical protein